MVPGWIGTVAGRVDPQGFAEKTPLYIAALFRLVCIHRSAHIVINDTDDESTRKR